MKTITQTILQATVIIALLNLINLYFYYRSFQISILDYLSLDDVYLCFAVNSSLFILMVILLFVFGTKSIYGFVVAIENEGFNDFEYNWWEKVKRIFISEPFFIFGGGCLTFSAYIVKENYGDDFTFKYVLWIFIFMMIIYYKLINSYLFDKKLSKQWFTNGIVILFIAFYYAISLTDVLNPKSLEDKKSQYIQIEYDDYEVKSGHNLFYIGKTSKYFFFKNKLTNRAEVYPVEGVKKIIL